MKNTTDNNNININNDTSVTDLLSTTDLGNSYDYLNEFYVNSYDYFNSFDYVVDNGEDDIEDILKKASSRSKGCHVVSNDDSINIVHESGSSKHIKKKNYECASDKYNKNKTIKKAQKEAIKRAKEIKQATNKTSTSYKKTTPVKTYPDPLPTYNHRQTTTSSQTNKSSNGGCLKLILLLLFFGPCVLPIIFGILEAILDIFF